MILSWTLRGVERDLLVEWDAGPLDHDAAPTITFADRGPEHDLTELERQAIADEADERAWLAFRAGELDRARAAP